MSRADCSTCGAEFDSREPHACPPAVLRGIDAADSAAWGRELDPLKRGTHNWTQPDYATRLRDGFAARGDA